MKTDNVSKTLSFIWNVFLFLVGSAALGIYGHDLFEHHKYNAWFSGAIVITGLILAVNRVMKIEQTFKN